MPPTQTGTGPGILIARPPGPDIRATATVSVAGPSTFGKSPAIPQYHHTKVDESDLASASSSDDEDAAMPLARRLNSPLKTGAPPPHLPVSAVAHSSQPHIPAATKAKASALPAFSKAPIKQKVPSAKKASAPAQHMLLPVPPPSISVPPITRPVPKIPSASSSRSRSSDRSSSSKSVSPAPAAGPSGSTPVGALKKRKHAESDLLEPDEHLAFGESKKARSINPTSIGKSAPRTAAKTASVSKLSRPISERPSDASDSSSSQNPLAASKATLDVTAPPIALADAVSIVGTRKIDDGMVANKNVSDLEGDSGLAVSAPMKAVSRPPSLALSDVSAGMLPPPPSSSVRLPSPLPSPGLHSLPAKPVSGTNSPLHAPLSAPTMHRSKSPVLTASTIKAGPAMASVSSSPIAARQASTSGIASKPLPASLPARPSTVVAPTLSRSTSTSSIAHSHKVATSGLASGASSPIISHFAKRTESSGPARASSPPSATTPSKYAKEGFEPLEYAKIPNFEIEALAADSTTIPNSKKRSSAYDITFTCSEEEEGEVSAQGESVEAEKEEEDKIDVPRGRSTDKKSVTSSSSVFAQVIKKSSSAVSPASAAGGGVGNGRPLKKGRAAELLAAEGGSAAGSRSQTISRATTPNSHGTTRDQSPSFSSHLGRKGIALANDADFKHYSKRFVEDLFPAYSALHRRLDEERESLATSGKNKSSMPSMSELAKLVEEANERGRELERIREALAIYNEDKKKGLLGA